MNKDKNGKSLKIGDKFQNKKGEVGQIQEIGGAKMLVFRYDNSRIRKTVVLSKADLTQMKKVG